MTPLVWAAILAGICLLPPGLTASRAEGIATTPITLPPGRDRLQIHGQVKGYTSRTYSFGAEAGQMLTLSLSSRGASSYFNLYAPGFGPGDQALANGSMTGPMAPDLNRFEGRLPASGQLYDPRLSVPGSGAARGNLRVHAESWPARRRRTHRPGAGRFRRWAAGRARFLRGPHPGR